MNQIEIEIEIEISLDRDEGKKVGVKNLQLLFFFTLQLKTYEKGENIKEGRLCTDISL